MLIITTLQPILNIIIMAFSVRRGEYVARVRVPQTAFLAAATALAALHGCYASPGIDAATRGLPCGRVTAPQDAAGFPLFPGRIR